MSFFESPNALWNIHRGLDFTEGYIRRALQFKQELNEIDAKKDARSILETLYE